MLKKVTAVMIPLFCCMVLVVIGTFYGCLKEKNTKTDSEEKEKIVSDLHQTMLEINPKNATGLP